MSAPYFVILDNTLVNEPLAPGIPYWVFPLKALPTRATSEQFVEDVLYQSELWANSGSKDSWVSLRLLACRHMCSRCGRLLTRLLVDDGPVMHVVWFIATNPYPQFMGHQAALRLGFWHKEYLEHRCQSNFFEPVAAPAEE
ncbi:MAG: hypothetical protein ACOC9E_02140 [Chloroflexota bacterium]